MYNANAALGWGCTCSFMHCWMGWFTISRPPQVENKHEHMPRNIQDIVVATQGPPQYLLTLTLTKISPQINIFHGVCAVAATCMHLLSIQYYIGSILLRGFLAAKHYFVKQIKSKNRNVNEFGSSFCSNIKGLHPDKPVENIQPTYNSHPFLIMCCILRD